MTQGQEQVRAVLASPANQTLCAGVSSLIKP